MAGTATAHAHHWHLPAATTLRLGWPRRLAAGVMVLIGGAFIAVTLMADLFSVGPAFDRLTDGFRPVMTQSQITAYQRDVQGLSAAGSELQTKLLPALARQLHMTPAQLQQMMATQYRDVATGVAQLQPISAQFTGVLANLRETQPLFVSADAIPTKDIPSTSVPWSLFAVGLVLLGLGVLVWFSPKVRAPIIATALGAALVALPLSLNMVTKASDADRMNANLKPVYTQAFIQNADRSLATLGAMGGQMQERMLPQLAARLHLTGAEMAAMLEQFAPNTATALGGFDTTMSSFQNLIAQFDKHLADYKTLEPVSFEPIVWFMIGGGAALFLLGAAGIVICRGRAPAG